MRYFRLPILIIGFFLYLSSQQPIAHTHAQIQEMSIIFLPAVLHRSIYDPTIDHYLQMVDLSRIQSNTENLVVNFSPRNHEFNRIYIDLECNLGGQTFSKNNLLRTLDELKRIFTDIGYSIAIENVPEKYGGGYNILLSNPSVATSNTQKVIDIGAHIDAWKSWDSDASTPGASDNAVSVAGLIEMSYLLKDYPNQHPWQFVIFVSEERGRYGSKIHVQNLTPSLFKTALILDGIGWSEIDPDKMNCIWAYDDIPETVKTAELFNSVKDQYQIPINWRRCDATLQTSDHQSYHDADLPAVLSIGGLPYGGVNYHNCNDNMANVDFMNAYYTIQQNIAVLMTLDKEP